MKGRQIRAEDDEKGGGLFSEIEFWSGSQIVMYKLLVSYGQCDQMARFFVQRLAIYNNENLPDCIFGQSMPKILWNTKQTLKSLKAGTLKIFPQWLSGHTART